MSSAEFKEMEALFEVFLYLHYQTDFRVMDVFFLQLGVPPFPSDSNRLHGVLGSQVFIYSSLSAFDVLDSG